MNIIEDITQSKIYDLRKARINKEIQLKYNLSESEIFCLQNYRLWFPFWSVEHEHINNLNYLYHDLDYNPFKQGLVKNCVVNAIRKFPVYNMKNKLYRLVKLHTHEKIDFSERLVTSFTDNLEYISEFSEKPRKWHNDSSNSNLDIFVLQLDNHMNLWYDLREISNMQWWISESEINFLWEEVKFYESKMYQKEWVVRFDLWIIYKKK